MIGDNMELSQVLKVRDIVDLAGQCLLLQQLRAFMLVELDNKLWIFQYNRLLIVI